jgi:2-polyprenyl-3-methyl-5-hydroxy-6-metoxy-1,4-benzoquinol methylase
MCSDIGYLVKELLPENIYAHTKKVELLRLSLDCIRRKLGRPLRILDIGCGSGYAVTRFLANGIDEIIGIDLHAASIEYANQHFCQEGVKFYQKSAEELQQSQENFDVIIMADFLEHVQNPEAILSQARKMLNSGGWILLSVPNGRGPFEIESFISRQPVISQIVLICAKIVKRILMLLTKQTPIIATDPREIPYNSGSTHIHFFSRKNLIALFKQSGFNIYSWRNLSFLSGPYTGEMFSTVSGFCQWNKEIADRLPSDLVSCWYFELSTDHSLACHED